MLERRISVNLESLTAGNFLSLSEIRYCSKGHQALLHFTILEFLAQLSGFDALVTDTRTDAIAETQRVLWGIQVRTPRK